MNIKVIKDNGLLKEGDILIWDDSLKLYSLDKTEEDHGENISSSLSISYKISEEGVLDNYEYFIFITEDGVEIEIHGDDEEQNHNCENCEGICDPKIKTSELQGDLWLSYVNLKGRVEEEFSGLDSTLERILLSIEKLEDKVKQLEKRTEEVSIVNYKTTLNTWPFRTSINYI